MSEPDHDKSVDEGTQMVWEAFEDYLDQQRLEEYP